VPQLAVAVGKVIGALFATEEGEEPAAAEKTVKPTVSPLATPAPVTLAESITVVPVTESTVVPTGITLPRADTRRTKRYTLAAHRGTRSKI